MDPTPVDIFIVGLEKKEIVDKDVLELIRIVKMQRMIIKEASRSLCYKWGPNCGGTAPLYAGEILNHAIYMNVEVK